MCEFCHTHGEGKKWYLHAKNYSEDLLHDVRRRKLVQDFFSRPESLTGGVDGMARLARAPALVRGMIRRLVTRRMKKTHFGQVVPVEEIEQIFGFVNSIVRVACVCRKATLGQEKRFCYGVSLGPDGGELGRIFQGIDSSFFQGILGAGLERLGKDEAAAAFRSHEKEGMCHTVWTFGTPFIGGICNCDRSDCLAMRATVTHAMPLMFRAEWVARIDPALCVGCRECMRLCQFGAILYSAANRKAAVDVARCYGCGICRAACKKNAIVLDDRRAVLAAAHLW